MRLIDADALIERKFKNDISYNAFVSLVKRQTTIDPVKHGRWIITDAWPHNVYCSECFKTSAQVGWQVWADGTLPRYFCPNCGAKMDGGEE